MDHFFTCHGCKPGRHFLPSCLEVNGTGYSKFDEPISARLQRYLVTVVVYILMSAIPNWHSKGLKQNRFWFTVVRKGQI